MYVICFRPTKNISLQYALGLHSLFLSNTIRRKNQFKENLKTSKTTKEATKENKQDVADGYENEAQSP